jgi:hypothetical protein
MPTLSRAEIVSPGDVPSTPMSSASSVGFNRQSPSRSIVKVSVVAFCASQRPHATGHASATDVSLLSVTCGAIGADNHTSATCRATPTAPGKSHIMYYKLERLTAHEMPYFSN